MKSRALPVAVLIVGLGLAAAAACLPSPATAQSIDLGTLLPEGQKSASARIIQLVGLITVLSLAPGILVTVTCFTRLIVAFSFLRSGLGLASTPSGIVLVSLALFMTAFIMTPTLDRMWKEGLEPFIENRIDEREAYRKTTAPLREFMRANVREKDLQLFEQLLQQRVEAAGGKVEAVDDDLRVLVPAFMISELRRGFEIGFLILLPFLVIDLVVATIVMSMGMMMLPPTAISLPFKVLFFVLIDGWNLLVGSLVRSFA